MSRTTTTTATSVSIRQRLQVASDNDRNDFAHSSQSRLDSGVVNLIVQHGPACGVILGCNSDVSRAQLLHKRLPPSIHPKVDDVCVHCFEVDMNARNRGKLANYWRGKRKCGMVGERDWDGGGEAV